MTVRIADFAAESGIGYHPVNGVQQDLQASNDSSLAVIAGCRVRDYPLLMKVFPWPFADLACPQVKDPHV